MSQILCMSVASTALRVGLKDWRSTRRRRYRSFRLIYCSIQTLQSLQAVSDWLLC